LTTQKPVGIVDSQKSPFHHRQTNFTRLFPHLLFMWRFQKWKF